MWQKLVFVTFIVTNLVHCSGVTITSGEIEPVAASTKTSCELPVFFNETEIEVPYTSKCKILSTLGVAGARSRSVALTQAIPQICACQGNAVIIGDWKDGLLRSHLKIEVISIYQDKLAKIGKSLFLKEAVKVLGCQDSGGTFTENVCRIDKEHDDPFSQTPSGRRFHQRFDSSN